MSESIPPADLETPADTAARHDAYDALAELADWSPWTPFADALAHAPRLPGVYLLREPATGWIRYAGMAGERAGSGRPQGLRGRLSVYRTGKGAVSGFGEAALDRALADPDWLEAKLHHLRARGPQRAKDWARDAIARLAPEVAWATCAEGADARHLESQVVALLRPHGSVEPVSKADSAFSRLGRGWPRSGDTTERLDPPMPRPPRR